MEICTKPFRNCIVVQKPPCVQLNELYTDWFPTKNGVRQGDSLSPTLFNIFLNDLATDLKSKNCGIDINGYNLSILLYADDIVLLSENEDDLQKMLDALTEWCSKWQMVINDTKSQIVHFRKKNTEVTKFKFKLGDVDLSIVNKYKYLGVVLDEFLDYKIISECLAVGGGRALGAVNMKFKTMKNMGLGTYQKLFENCVIPVLHYGAGVWGLQAHTCTQNVQNRAMRFYLGTHELTPTLGMSGDLGWHSLYIFRQIDAIRLWNRFINMSNSRVNRKVFMWDYHQCSST